MMPLRLFFGKLAAKKNEAKTPLQNPASFAEFFAKYAQTRQNRPKSCAAFNIFDICQVGRDELRNCQILAWLLDERGSHGLGNAFLAAFLAQCPKMPISAQVLAGGHVTRKEFCPNADNADRVDIVCDGKDFLLYIEVKIDSLEHTGQTGRYLRKLRGNAGRRESALAFISPGLPPENQESAHLTWKKCADVLDSLAHAKARDDDCCLTEVLRQYAVFIRKF